MNTNNTDMNRDGLPPEGSDGQLPFAQGDEMDVLLREWHGVNRAKAAEGRDRLLAALRAEDAGAASSPIAVEVKPAPALRVEGSGAGGWKIWRMAPLAAAAVLTLAVLAPFMLPATKETAAHAELANIVMCPEGGKLEAYDAGGVLLGACVLEHTDVAAEISGHVARVTLTQRFRNPHADKIEAVYTFPMSHRGAVDRMSMAIGDRVIVGEVKERDAAREIYEQARSAGLVAGLTEQERPNIFTQSVANIEPGATIAVTLSYVEFVEEKDGEFTFNFPTVVGPRYIPGEPKTGDEVPGFVARRGIVLQGPASFEFVDRGPGFARSDRGPDQRLLAAAINGAMAIAAPISVENEDRWVRFTVTYADGVKEEGMYFDSPAGTVNVGYVADRWFAITATPLAPRGKRGEARVSGEPGAAFAPDTDQVPDASRITPMPVRPGTRAGHDLSISVKIHTGGPGLLKFNSPLHEIVTSEGTKRTDGLAESATVVLKKMSAIPNRDFVLSWRQTAEGVTDQVFTHTGRHGNFFGLMLRPPARVDDAMAVPREMIFVLDTSGSMNGFPIEKSKEVMERALTSMREGDTFNVITFAGSTNVLWDKPRAVSEANLAEARSLVSRQRGGGGTEMMTAVNAALVQPAGDDDREVRPLRIVVFLTDGYVGNEVAIIDAVKKNRGTTRVFSFGIGNSVNRYLLDSIAIEGGGAAEYVLLESEGAAAVERLTKRTRTPVLTDISLEFSKNLRVIDMVPPLTNVPDLFDETPVTILGRYTAPGAGTVTISGMTAAGPWQRTITLSLPESQPEHDTIATMWARGKVEQIKSGYLRDVQQGTLKNEVKQQIVQLGEQFGIMSEYTSFVAVDKLRVTVAGKPRLVNVPIELPAGTSFEGFFGQAAPMNGEDQAGGSIDKLLGQIPQIVRVEAVAQNTWVDSDRGGEEGAKAYRLFDTSRMINLQSVLTGGTTAKSAPPPAPSAAAAAAPGAPPAPSRSAAPAPASRGGESTRSAVGGRGQESAERSALPQMQPRDAASLEAKKPNEPSVRDDAMDRRGDPLHRNASRPSSSGAPVPSSGRGLNADWERVAKEGEQVLARIGERAQFRYLTRLSDAGEAQRGVVEAQSPGSTALGLPVAVTVAEPQRQDQVQMVVPAQQVARRIGQLAAENQTEQARGLVNELNRAAPSYEVGRDMWTAMNETKAPEAEQNRQVVALAQQATQELQAAARLMELHRKLDERLWIFATGEGVLPSAGMDASVGVAACNNMVDPKSRQVAAQAGVEFRELGAEGASLGVMAMSATAALEQGVIVTVLVTSTDAAVIERLKAAGMIVEDVQAKARVVVGVVPVGMLADFALLDCVRRVEATGAE